MHGPASASLLIAQEFLQTVVIVDDQADLGYSRPFGEGNPGQLTAQEEDNDGGTAGVGSGLEGAYEPVPVGGLEEPADDELSVAVHGDLDAKTVIDGFAQMGLVCGVIRPGPDDDLGPIVNPAAERADILVLDWWMHHDGGETSKSIISHLAGLEPHHDRIRLIAIYTAVPDLGSIADELARALGGAVVGEGRNRVVAGSINVIVLAKPDTDVAPALAQYVVAFDHLATRVVSEFAVIVEGLLSNVAFAALAAIRGNTYKVLSRFDRMLDPAFLAHRMLLPNPEDSQQHLVDLIIQELAAVLDDKDVGKGANSQAVGQLVADSALIVEAAGRLAEFASRNDCSVEELAMRFVRDGVNSEALDLSRKERKDIRSWLSKIFSQSSRDHAAGLASIDEQWSMLMSSKLNYGQVVPELRLGVLVRDSKSGMFMLCMQPACDSVRLVGETSFPFLPLEPAAEGSDIVVLYEREYRALNVKMKLRDLILVSFMPNPESGGSVKTQRSNDGAPWQFIPALSGNASLEWVGQLRDNFAQKFANAFAASASRVGTNDSELFRRG